MAAPSKMTKPLLQKVQSTEPAELVEVVVELLPSGIASTRGTQAERVAALDQAFSSRARPVEEAIRGVGGQVLERLWINDCLRARVPAAALPALAGIDLVFSIDTGHPIKRER